MAVKVRRVDHGWDALRDRVRELGQSRVRVGVLQSSAAGQEVAGGGGITMAELAAIHEFGAPAAGIPERSFLRRTFRDQAGRDALVKFAERGARALVAGKVTVAQALDALGLWAVAQVKRRIREQISPPNAPSTIAKKGSSTPLVDTGQLINSITHERTQ